MGVVGTDRLGTGSRRREAQSLARGPGGALAALTPRLRAVPREWHRSAYRLRIVPGSRAPRRGSIRRAYDWAFVAYQVGGVVEVGGSARVNQCVAKGDSVADLISLRQPVTPATLVAWSAAYSESLCTEATSLLEHIGEAVGSATLFEAEMRDTAVDRATWSNTDMDA